MPDLLLVELPVEVESVEIVDLDLEIAQAHRGCLFPGGFYVEDRFWALWDDAWPWEYKTVVIVSIRTVTAIIILRYMVSDKIFGIVREFPDQDYKNFTPLGPLLYLVNMREIARHVLMPQIHGQVHYNPELEPGPLQLRETSIGFDRHSYLAFIPSRAQPEDFP